VSADFQVRIANFGLAALLRAAGASAAEQGGHGQADAPGADLFALGVLGYALITGFTPFAGEGFGDPRTSPPPDPGEFVPDLTESQARVLLDMLGAAPERPHRTAADAVGALDAALVPSGASNGQG
jgi:hypothetical protein